MRVLGLALLLLVSSANAHLPEGVFVWGNGEGFVVQKEIGEGQEGQTVLVERIRDGRLYVLKIITKPSQRLSADVRSAHLVQSQIGRGDLQGGTIGVDSYGWYTVFSKEMPKDGITMFGVLMPFIPSENLSAYIDPTPLEEGRTLEPWEIRLIATHLLQVVESNARRNIVHQDIKPSNILVRWRNPFGPSFRNDLVLHLADTGLVAPVRGIMNEGFDGTLLFAAPEKVNDNTFGAQPISDVYSVGVTVAMLLLERAPYARGLIPLFSGIGEQHVHGLHYEVQQHLDGKIRKSQGEEKKDLIFLKEIILATTQFGIADRLAKLGEFHARFPVFRRPWSAALFYQEGPGVFVQRSQSKSPDLNRGYGLACLTRLAALLERRSRRL